MRYAVRALGNAGFILLQDQDINQVAAMYNNALNAHDPPVRIKLWYWLGAYRINDQHFVIRDAVKAMKNLFIFNRDAQPNIALYARRNVVMNVCPQELYDEQGMVALVRQGNHD